MKNHKESGFVSLVTAATILIILALITIGFTRLMQREQRQALDRQLSRQAIYAAESGINNVLTAIKKIPGLPEQKLDCDPNSYSAQGLTLPTSLDTTGRIEYTCVQYDKSPPEITFEPNQTASQITQLETASGNSFTTLTFSWENADSSLNDTSRLPDCSAAEARDLPASRSGANATIPVLRLDLTSNATLSRTALINNVDNLYLLPCNGAGADSTYTFTTTTKGNVELVRCDTARCVVNIDVSSVASSLYSARFRPIYDDARVSISGQESSGVGNVEAQFAGQLVIDVTAKANDVIRRLRSSVPGRAAAEGPEAVIQSFNGVCKLYEVNDQAGSESITNTGSCNTP